MKIKYDMETMKLMDCFTRITHARLKDCFLLGDAIHFIVEENDMGRAIGKSGSKAKMVEKLLNRKIKIVEFNPDVLQFTKNALFPLKVKGITADDGVIMIEAPDSKTRGFMIGRAAQNLRNLESVVKRYFNITEIKVR